MIYSTLAIFAVERRPARDATAVPRRALSRGLRRPIVAVSQVPARGRGARGQAGGPPIVYVPKSTKTPDLPRDAPPASLDCTCSAAVCVPVHRADLAPCAGLVDRHAAGPRPAHGRRGPAGHGAGTLATGQRRGRDGPSDGDRLDRRHGAAGGARAHAPPLGLDRRRQRFPCAPGLGVPQRPGGLDLAPAPGCPLVRAPVAGTAGAPRPQAEEGPTPGQAGHPRGGGAHPGHGDHRSNGIAARPKRGACSAGSVSGTPRGGHPCRSAGCWPSTRPIR